MLSPADLMDIPAPPQGAAYVPLFGGSEVPVGGDEEPFPAPEDSVFAYTLGKFAMYIQSETNDIKVFEKHGDVWKQILVDFNFCFCYVHWFTCLEGRQLDVVFPYTDFLSTLHTCMKLLRGKQFMDNFLSLPPGAARGESLSWTTAGASLIAQHDLFDEDFD